MPTAASNDQQQAVEYSGSSSEAAVSATSGENAALTRQRPISAVSSDHVASIIDNLPPASLDDLLRNLVEELDGAAASSAAGEATGAALLAAPKLAAADGDASIERLLDVKIDLDDDLLSMLPAVAPEQPKSALEQRLGAYRLAETTAKIAPPVTKKSGFISLFPGRYIPVSVRQQQAAASAAEPATAAPTSTSTAPVAAAAVKQESKQSKNSRANDPRYMTPDDPKVVLSHPDVICDVQQEQFECKRCDKTFSSKNSLQTHVMWSLEHDKNNKWKNWNRCEACGEPYHPCHKSVHYKRCTAAGENGHTYQELPSRRNDDSSLYVSQKRSLSQIIADLDSDEEELDEEAEAALLAGSPDADLVFDKLPQSYFGLFTASQHLEEQSQKQPQNGSAAAASSDSSAADGTSAATTQKGSGRQRGVRVSRSADKNGVEEKSVAVKSEPKAKRPRLGLEKLPQLAPEPVPLVPNLQYQQPLIITIRAILIYRAFTMFPGAPPPQIDLSMLPTDPQCEFQITSTTSLQELGDIAAKTFGVPAPLCIRYFDTQGNWRDLSSHEAWIEAVRGTLLASSQSGIAQPLQLQIIKLHRMDAIATYTMMPPTGYF